MKKSIFMIAAVLSGLLLGCNKEKISGGGSIVTETRAVENFQQVAGSGSSQIFITQGANFEVKVKAYENIISSLETKVQNGTLLIGFKSNTNIQNDNSEIYITMPALNSVSVSGSGNLSTKGNFLGMDYFTATTTGSGAISIEKGNGKNVKINISGSGDVKSFGFETEQAIVDISGSGDVELTVSKNLKATLKGSGNVYYKGNATVDSQSTGSGKVIRK